MQRGDVEVQIILWPRRKGQMVWRCRNQSWHRDPCDLPPTAIDPPTPEPAKKVTRSPSKRVATRPVSHHLVATCSSYTQIQTQGAKSQRPLESHCFPQDGRTGVVHHSSDTSASAREWPHVIIPCCNAPRRIDRHGRDAIPIAFGCPTRYTLGVSRRC
jgi:hypothetical protein